MENIRLKHNLIPPELRPNKANSVFWRKLGAFLLAALGAGAFTVSTLYVMNPSRASGPSSNRILSYQMRLSDDNGIPVDGTKDVILNFYVDPSTPTVLHTDCGTTGAPTARSVTFTSGVATVLIGDTSATTCPGATNPNALPADLFDSAALYLGVEVDSDGEMNPRKRIVSSGYALNSDLLDDLDTSDSGGSSYDVLGGEDVAFATPMPRRGDCTRKERMSSASMR